MAEQTDGGNSQCSAGSIRVKARRFGNLQSSTSGQNVLVRDRLFSGQPESSDHESINFSTRDGVINVAVVCIHDRNLVERFTTGDEGGITNQEESATDNNSDIRSFLAGIGQSNHLLSNAVLFQKREKGNKMSKIAS